MTTTFTPTLNRVRKGALALVCTGLLFGASTAAASADPTLTPTPQPQGPIARTPADAGTPLPGGVAGPCFSCQPNHISDNPPAAAPGPAPTVSPVLTHSNSGANHDDLTVDGVDFTPNKSVHIELRPDHDGDFNPYVTDRGANQSGAIHVQFYGLQTVSPHDRGARGGYVVATDTTTLQSTAALPVTIFPAVMIDHN